ncbi:SMP-30/gluconolactonase/LRE family protein [Novispirillum itersonii]|uniref:SMP-30/gluconolactonase/LRE family protein n=1 Tax=Novispirillum itersonii TaxID=189 RepID=UPI000378C129|nr:SMP-30/gluconolactonase/LRE family protein [Novispirillum itersonii]
MAVRSRRSRRYGSSRRGGGGRLLAALLGAAVAGGAAYLALWPVPLAPVAWQAPQFGGYTGPHATNRQLANLQALSLGGATGPEHLATGPDGALYAAVHDGRILRLDPAGGLPQEVAVTGGRVLGFAFDADGRMIAADALRGLVAIAANGAVTPLLTQVGPGDPLIYANSVTVAADGTVYFTASSDRFDPARVGGTFEASVLDILEQSATGRVLAYTPTDGKVRVVAQGLSFANGIALSADGTRLLVAETGRYRIWSIDMQADAVNVSTALPDSAAARVLLDNLPGYPDNLMRGRDGRTWVGLIKPRNPLLDRLSALPEVRAALLRLPRSLWPVPKPYGHVFAFDANGTVTQDLQDPTGAYPDTSGATENGNRLYIHSLTADRVGWVALP